VFCPSGLQRLRAPNGGPKSAQAHQRLSTPRTNCLWCASRQLASVYGCLGWHLAETCSTQRTEHPRPGMAVLTTMTPEAERFW
jgi:hypothetical protein